MILSWVWVTTMDQSNHARDSVFSQIRGKHSITDPEAEMERQVAQRKLDYTKTDVDADVSTTIMENFRGDITKTGIEVDWPESKNTEEQSHHQYYCEVGLKVSLIKVKGKHETKYHA